MNKATIFLACYIGLFASAMADQKEETFSTPTAFIGSQTVWKHASVQVVMADKEERMIAMTLRGESSSEKPDKLVIFFCGKPLQFKSKESVLIQKALQQILEKTDSNNWKHVKIELLLGFLENSPKYDGIDASELLKDQPFEEIFSKIVNLKKPAKCK
jgi:hypothetical protein